jgi:hypothetical protein
MLLGYPNGSHFTYNYTVTGRMMHGGTSHIPPNSKLRLNHDSGVDYWPRQFLSFLNRMSCRDADQSSASLGEAGGKGAFDLWRTVS